MSISLTVSDNLDGSGGVATISGSDPAAVNTLLYAPWTVAQHNQMWFTGSNRTGDGTISISSLALGTYFWMVDSVLAGSHSFSNIYMQAITDVAETPPHVQALNGLVAKIQALITAGRITGIDIDKVVAIWTPRELDQIDSANLPQILLAPIGKENEVGLLTSQDDIEYPVYIAIVDRSNQDYFSNIRLRSLWRNVIAKAVRHQRVLGATTVMTTGLKYDWTLDPAAFRSNLHFSGLLALPRSRELRG